MLTSVPYTSKESTLGLKSALSCGVADGFGMSALKIFLLDKEFTTEAVADPAQADRQSHDRWRASAKAA